MRVHPAKRFEPVVRALVAPGESIGGTAVSQPARTVVDGHDDLALGVGRDRIVASVQQPAESVREYVPGHRRKRTEARHAPPGPVPSGEFSSCGRPFGQGCRPHCSRDPRVAPR
ncbi:hypothetical protein PUR34_24490 [Streptomyces sp. JV185]|uniref:hypothetical protein n=1 Tax=Streptomyces sp. JV185 TaxID=858638 RepID=UPI002E7A24CA|nr:hypothetical protein [Streptomyces sp. JV185]MEE1771210.1 hypothetical protein [Streptomyces sp. JV185]